MSRRPAPVSTLPKPAIGKPIRLRVISTHEMLLEPIRQQAQKDLGIEIDYIAGDWAQTLRNAVLHPESFDLYDEWHAVDLAWTAQAIQPIDIERIESWSEIDPLRLAKPDKAGASLAPYRHLFLQKDGSLGQEESGQTLTIPAVHGVDSFGYLRNEWQRHGNPPDSWAAMLSEEWAGKVAVMRDPALGIIEMALAAEAAGLLHFEDIGNLAVEEIDALIALLIQKRKAGHFRGFWNNYEDAVKLMRRGGVALQSIWSPSLVALRRHGVDVVSATPREGYRGFYSGLCLSSRCRGAVQDAAYAYINWWLSGWPGAAMARQGYYMSTSTRSRAHLSASEWEYWYGGGVTQEDLRDPYGLVAIKAGSQRDGGSYATRMSRVRIWNHFMDEHNYIVRRWHEFLGS